MALCREFAPVRLGRYENLRSPRSIASGNIDGVPEHPVAHEAIRERKAEVVRSHTLIEFGQRFRVLHQSVRENQLNLCSGLRNASTDGREQSVASP